MEELTDHEKSEGIDGTDERKKERAAATRAINCSSDGWIDAIL